MSKILYYDCFAGISGDMNLGAMVDLGVDAGWLSAELEKLGIAGLTLRVTREQRHGVAGARVTVQSTAEAEGSVHAHRTFEDISQLIRASRLSPAVIETSLAIFLRLADAEAKIHDCAIGKVHFHEVGAVDSIADIVGAALCLEYLKPDRIFCSPVQVGEGLIECAHGTYPVPAPASAELLKGIPIRSGLVPYEATTPTGAAILAETVDEFGALPSFVPSLIGYGIGSADGGALPNVLRLVLGEDSQTQAEDLQVGEAYLVECNIDDMNPELYESVMGALYAGGAQDVFLTPLIMKKSRPGVKISALCSGAKRAEIERILLLETTTLGVRVQRSEKTMLRREAGTVSTQFGEVTVKHAYYQGKKVRTKVEYEECRRISQEQGISLKEVYDRLKSEGL